MDEISTCLRNVDLSVLAIPCYVFFSLRCSQCSRLRAVQLGNNLELLDVIENITSSVAIGTNHYLRFGNLICFFFPVLNFRWLLSTFIMVAILRFIIGHVTNLNFLP